MNYTNLIRAKKQLPIYRNVTKILQKYYNCVKNEKSY